MHRLVLFTCLSLLGTIQVNASRNAGAGKHVVLISGDEEYRSEEAMPMLAEILKTHHTFKTTVLYPINTSTGDIDPNTTDNIPGLEALASADLMIVFTRFRNIPDSQMKHIDAYLQTGKPIIGIRPSVVAFRTDRGSLYEKYSSNYQAADFSGGFGRQVLGATWISHHGRHKVESTLGIPVDSMKTHPILRGVGKMWGPTDVYTVKTPIPHNGQVLVMGQVLKGMKATAYSPKAQMPLAWIKTFPTPKGDARVFMSTMGDGQDFEDPNFRRMIVNACIWAVGNEAAITKDTNVDIVSPYTPHPFGFNGFIKGRRPPILKLKHGSKLCVIGNSLGERMQHDGWLETLIQNRFPTKNLVFRNLCFPADELTVRPRQMNFGDPDKHLTHSKADVVFAFFGYNESFDKGGVPKFKADLTAFIKKTRDQTYNGQTPPRLVLFSPIAHENLHQPDLPDGTKNNARLALFRDAMRDVTAKHGVTFVDLFDSSQTLYESTDSPLTINGIHLNSEGNRRIAGLIDHALFGTQQSALPPTLSRLRQAVLTKNKVWHDRYRATDGFSSYGTRGYLSFRGQTNKEVMDREFDMLDIMTANRDKRIWAVAQNRELKVPDDNLPPPLKVRTNKPGSGKDGTHPYLGGDEAISKMEIASTVDCNLFASEEAYPQLVNPVQMAVDPDGRIWAAVWPSYPHKTPTAERNDKLIILPDTDQDGKADQCIVFAEGLHNPTGFEFWNNGVLVACPPDIFFMQDLDGDNKADTKIRILQGIDSADTHCGANSFIYGPDGHFYFSEGIFHYTNIERLSQKPLRVSNGCVQYRWNPRTHAINVNFSISPNPHGNAIDEWGYMFTTDATSGNGYYVAYPGKKAPHKLYHKRARPVAGLGIISGTHFPKKQRGNLLICNTIGRRGVLQLERSTTGADIYYKETEPLVMSSDVNFHPTDVEIGGDGAIYVSDWANVIIGHMQHNLRDPSRDHAHGRIYRFTSKTNKPLTNIKLSALNTPALLRQLASKEHAVRYRTRLLLSGRDREEILSELPKWINTLDPESQTDAHAITEALWLYEQNESVNEAVLAIAIASPHPMARAAATRVLGHWGRKISNGPLLLQLSANDPHAMVRHEAIVAATAFAPNVGLTALLTVCEKDTDPQIRLSIRHALDDLHISPKEKEPFLAMLNAIDARAKPAPKPDKQTPTDIPDRVITLSTVPEAMRYSLSTFSVKRGERVKVIFQNRDNMPHNLVIGNQGSFKEIGSLADKMLVDVGAAKKHYLPDTPEILFSTKVISEHSNVELTFVAPNKTGGYPYLCTLPGHWRMMNGLMNVE